MYGEQTTLNDKILRDSVSNVLLKHIYDWEKSLKDIKPSVKIRYAKEVPFSWIKEMKQYFGENTDYISTMTDCGEDKKSSVDGGVVFLEIFGIKLPLAWFEVKSSNSCKKHSSRGQATGLISEQESRCRSWCSPFLCKVKPLVAIMQGEDFNAENGNYNIDRIKMDLHTSGNCSPYDENVRDSVSWLFYGKSFTQSQLESIVYKVIDTNVKKMKEIIKNI